MVRIGTRINGQGEWGIKISRIRSYGNDHEPEIVNGEGIGINRKDIVGGLDCG